MSHAEVSATSLAQLNLCHLSSSFKPCSYFVSLYLILPITTPYLPERSGIWMEVSWDSRYGIPTWLTEEKQTEWRSYLQHSSARISIDSTLDSDHRMIRILHSQKQLYQFSTSEQASLLIIIMLLLVYRYREATCQISLLAVMIIVRECMVSYSSPLLWLWRQSSIQDYQLLSKTVLRVQKPRISTHWPATAHTEWEFPLDDRQFFLTKQTDRQVSRLKLLCLCTV